MTDVSRRRVTEAPGQGTVPRQGGRSSQPPSQGGHGSGRRGAPPNGRSRRRKRRVGRTIGIASAALVLVVAGVGVVLYQHLNGNINSVAISGGGSEKADAFGRTPINILVIGSDGRSSTADCALGGDCGAGQNADVEMILHISADRSNATAMSIPRDTITRIPPCTDGNGKTVESGFTSTINTALQYGPDCQVKTVHQLTGIPIDHFTMIHFSGVVNMADAVGGVQVCVNNNVYDTDSHLKLSAGTHTVQGQAALEWLRSRHAFGDGSDLGRTYSQHMYLSGVMRKFKSAGTLTDPTALYGLADAATKALTVDTGLNSIAKLIGLADDINKVPTNRITFTTMQTMPDPNNNQHVVVGPEAESLFGAITNDQSLTGGGGSSKAAPSAPAGAPPSSPAPPAVPRSGIAVRVENGSGVTGRASNVAQDLINQGFSPDTSSGNAPASASSTSIRYAPGHQGEAQTVAHALGIPSGRLRQSVSVTGVTLLIGSDWDSGMTFPGGGSGSAPADTHRALSNAHAETADASKTCAKVSTFPTLKYKGAWMSPIRAYALSPNVPDSAP